MLLFTPSSLCLVVSIAAAVLQWHGTNVIVIGFSSATVSYHFSRSAWSRTVESFVALQYSTQQSDAENVMTVPLSQPEFDFTQWSRRCNGDDDEQNVSLNCEDFRAKLIVLSSDPLLLVSAEPILTKEQCRILLDWYRDAAGTSPTGTFAAKKLDQSTEEPSTAKSKLLGRLQQWVHHSLLGYKDHDYVVPRFISYPELDRQIDPSKVNKETLLPDGLHVDTNGNQQFRHWTVLVYLTSNANSGATTFPLAKRYPPVPMDSNDGRAEQALESADDMIYRHNKQHTRSVDTGMTFPEAVTLEEAAVDLWDRDHMNVSQHYTQTGIRVLPREGHVIVFSGISPDGYPNPRSFHGGECLVQGDGEKVLLSFFYEVPLDSFTSRTEFGERVVERERYFLERHFGAKL